MCGLPFWGFAAFVACAYLTYLSVAHVRRGELEWPHDFWSITSYAIWVLLMVGLMNETRCWRERIFFAVVMANFLLGFILAVHSKASEDAIRQMRIATSALWALAALLSLVLMFSSGTVPASEKK